MSKPFCSRSLGRPWIIAEMSGNHNHSLERALRIVDAAADAGVDAVKLQTYTADTMTMDCPREEFFIRDPQSLWHGESLYALYQKAFTPWEWHAPIFARCKERGIVGFSTPFDRTAVEFLEKLDVPCYKLASFENIDLPLVRCIAGTHKPLIASTGMATAAELDDLVRTARAQGTEELVLLKCTSHYPASSEDTNLATLPHLRELFHCAVGISDHTLGIGVSLAAVALGAVVIEKHFTLSRADGGVDAAFSLEPSEMRQLVQESRRAFQAIGGIVYGPTKQESVAGRRSLYIVEDMRAGERFTAKNVRSIRPGLGLSPKYYDVVMGKQASRDVRRGTPLRWELLA